MEWVQLAMDWVLHLDRHLNDLAGNFGIWTYAILFFIVFCETGLVVTPFLPGDSLLFACGALAATENAVLDVWILLFLLWIAAVLGDATNYQIGKFFGPKIFTQGNRKWLKKEHLDKTHAFYEKHGGKTIILARYIPIIRTFAPFVAGIGAMTYRRFTAYNVIGGLSWVGIFLALGYLFGNMPIVKKNFSVVILAIIIISIIPAAVEWWRSRRQSQTNHS